MSSFKSPSTSLPPRSSPFRRPASPSSPGSISSGRPVTPPSARVGASPMTSPSKLKQSYTVSEEEEEESMITTPTKSTTSHSQTAAIRAVASASSSRMFRSPQTRRSSASSPSKANNNTPVMTTYPSTNTAMPGTDALSRLPPALLHSLRESFAVLDPSSTGNITPASTHETLQSLGLDTSMIHSLFPPGANQSISLPQYLNQLANVLIELSTPQEMLNAFSAFDDDDSGQVDVGELRRALLTTAPDVGERTLTERDIDRALEGFTGRRMLRKNAIGLGTVRGLNNPVGNKKGGDVFRYQEFVGSLVGSGLDAQQMGQVTKAA